MGKWGINVLRVIREAEPCDVRMTLDMVERLQYDTDHSLMYAQEDHELYNWTTTDQLLATLIDAVNQNTSYVIQAAGGDAQDIPRMTTPLTKRMEKLEAEKVEAAKTPKTISEIAPESIATGDFLSDFFTKST